MPHPDIHRKELEEMGSPLADMPREMPFQSPPEHLHQTLQSVMARIHERSGHPAEMPEEELLSHSPRLAGADREMPYRLPADALPPTSYPLAPFRDTEMPETTLAGQAPRQPATLRRLRPLRTAAAILVLGATAWFLRMQMPAGKAPAPEAAAEAKPHALDSINDLTLETFLHDTEVVTAYETIGAEVAWTDAFSDIASADLTALDNELASLPESSLMEYVLQTGIHPIQP